MARNIVADALSMQRIEIEDGRSSEQGGNLYKDDLDINAMEVILSKKGSELSECQ